jgi:hypothetical protein
MTDMVDTNSDVDSRIQNIESKINALEMMVSDKLPDFTALPFLNEAPATEAVAQPTEPIPGQNVAEWVSRIGGSPGIVVDEDLAKTTPCLRIDLGDGMSPLIFSKGIVGALDEKQIGQYCTLGFLDKSATPQQLTRLQSMSEAAHVCHVDTQSMAGTPEHLKAYFSCLGKELKKKGVEP